MIEGSTENRKLRCCIQLIFPMKTQQAISRTDAATYKLIDHDNNAALVCNYLACLRAQS